jgi:integrase
MRAPRPRPVSGHTFKVERKRGAQWYAKYRLPDGRQVQKRIGPHWSRKEAPPPGYYTKRTAQAWLDELLVKARRGELGGLVRAQLTFAEACDEWLEYKRSRVKLSTLTDYREMIKKIKPAMAELIGDKARLASVTTETVEAYRDKLVREGRSDRTVNKYLGALTDLFRWAGRRYGLVENPVSRVERRPTAKRGNIDVYSKEEVLAVARAAANEQDAAIYTVAAFTGLRRGELLALRWRDVDFADAAIHVRHNLAGGQLTTPKGGTERTVPLMHEAAAALARLSGREQFTSEDDYVFCSKLGQPLSGRVVSRDYHQARERAGLRHLRFHDLRHTFGTHAIRVADSREVMEWMGHQDLATTQRYLQFKPRHDAARRLSEAFAETAPVPVRDA